MIYSTLECISLMRKILLFSRIDHCFCHRMRKMPPQAASEEAHPRSSRRKKQPEQRILLWSEYRSCQRHGGSQKLLPYIYLPNCDLMCAGLTDRRQHRAVQASGHRRNPPSGWKVLLWHFRSADRSGPFSKGIGYQTVCQMFRLTFHTGFQFLQILRSWLRSYRNGCCAYGFTWIVSSSSSTTVPA